VPWVGGRSSFDVVGQWWTMGSVKPQMLGYRGNMSELFGRKSDFSLEMSELF